MSFIEVGRYTTLNEVEQHIISVKMKNHPYRVYDLDDAISFYDGSHVFKIEDFDLLEEYCVPFENDTETGYVYSLKKCPNYCFSHTKTSKVGFIFDYNFDDSMHVVRYRVECLNEIIANINKTLFILPIESYADENYTDFQTRIISTLKDTIHSENSIIYGPDFIITEKELNTTIVIKTRKC